MSSLWCGPFGNKSGRNSNRDAEGNFSDKTRAKSSDPLSKANTTFSLALFRKLSEDNNTANIFFSPFSISSALAMVMLGARGNTATQISECLNTQDCQDEVHSQFAELLSQLNKPGASFTLSVANRLYGEKSYSFLQEFLTETRTHYNSEPKCLDFITSSEEARIKINNWVEEQTHGKIRDIVAEGVVDQMTRMVLVNALYFKGTWDEQFSRDDTQEYQFKLNKKTTKPVQMMRQELRYPYTFIREVNCQILEMPYKGKEMSMLIFLPKEIEDDTTGLQKLEKRLNYEKFMEWTRPKKMKLQKVKVYVPRFKLEEKYDLNRVLSSMGMEDAFDKTKCDFSGMSCQKLLLSKVSHKAFVEVNEEGTEASASTAVSGIEYGLLSVTPYFTADHPFLFFIRHNPTLGILFAGRVCSPE